MHRMKHSHNTLSNEEPRDTSAGSATLLIILRPQELSMVSDYQEIRNMWCFKVYLRYIVGLGSRQSLYERECLNTHSCEYSHVKFSDCHPWPALFYSPEQKWTKGSSRNNNPSHKIIQKNKTGENFKWVTEEECRRFINRLF